MSFLAGTLSQFWLTVQGRLFPWLAVELGELSEKQKQLVKILELLRIESFIKGQQRVMGRPLEDRQAIARAFLAKAVYNLETTRQLLDRLANDETLRRLCGWEREGELPSEATFSRAFAEFAESQLPARVHEALIEKYEKPRLVGHISRDATAISAREKAAKKVKKAPVKAQPKSRRRKKGEAVCKPLTRLQRQSGMTLTEMLAFPTLTEEQEIEDNPGGLLVALAQFGVGSLQVLIFIATAVCFLMWLYRCYENLTRFGTPARNISYSSGWAVGSFFVPFVNLVVPYRAIKELWRNSSRSQGFLSSQEPPAWFPLWWLFWLLSSFASRIHSRLVWRGESSRETIAILGVSADALTIIAAIFVMVVIEDITRRQEEVSTSLRFGQPPSQPPPPPTFEGSIPTSDTRSGYPPQ